MDKPKRKISVGLLFSTGGPYEVISRAMRDGALLAFHEVNSCDRFDFELVPQVRDPRGSLLRYSQYAEELLKLREVRHVIGCYTSSSRKDILPIFEKYDGLLWYPSHYEGFETSDNVIYLGATPNHHVVPLMRYILSNGCRSVYCVGANYIWAWEVNRIVRELTLAAGSVLVGERYLRVDDYDVGRIIDEIRALRPDYVINTQIGESSYTFYREFFRMKKIDNSLRDTRLGSCTLCEPELVEIGAGACAGHLSSSVYFSTIDSSKNREFTASYRQAYGERAMTSADAESSYNTVHLLAEALHHAGTVEPDEVQQALNDIEWVAPQGQLRIDSYNNHSYLTPRLGISREDGTFDIIWEADEPRRPDPYLVWLKASNISRSTEGVSGGQQQSHENGVPRNVR
jgi:branched-chain amino acid transport system substrate-binding protein